MPDRSSRSQRGGGFISISGLTPPELPDYQSDLNKQLSFLKSMDAYMNPGGSGGGTIRNANGLTPYQQAQMDYKLAKDAAKAAEAEAKKNVIVGTNPKTGQPMVYRNETGYKLSDKRMQEIYAGMLEDELRKDIANDEELNRIKGIAFGPRPISIDYRKQLERQYRDRTKALASIYKIDDRAAFDAAFGEQSKSIRNEQQRALNEDSFLGVLGSGVAQGWSDFLNAMRMPFQNETERLETARQSLKERQERIAASPTLREREMEEQEAAEQGKDISYWQATDKNRASNLAASVAGTLTSFAVPVAAGMVAAPVAAALGAPAVAAAGAGALGTLGTAGGIGTAASMGLTGVLGAGMNQLGQAQRAAQDPNLTEEQKTDMLSMSDPGFALTTGIGGVAGALMPGGVGSGALKLANKAVGDAAATGIRGTIGRAAVRSAERAAAPRTMGTLARDIAVNSGENAAIMGANTIGANIAYNESTGQPLMQGATQGALGAIGEGAIIGVPFGGARTLRRPRVARAEAPTTGESAAETPSNAGETPAPQTPAPQTPAAQPQNTTWTQRLRTDSGFRDWSDKLVQATRTNNEAKVDELVAEYLAGGGRLEDLELIRDSYAKDSNKRLVSDAEFAKTHDGLGHVRVSDEFGWTSKNDDSINAAIARWQEARDNDALDSKITGAFTGEPESSRVAGIMAELKPARAGSTAGQGNNADSAMEANPNANAKVTADGASVQNSANRSKAESERLGRKPTQNLGQDKSDTTNVVQEAAEQQKVVVPADLGGTRSRSVPASDGPGSELNPAVRRNGGPSNAAADSGGEQSSSQPVATRGTPKSGKNKGTPDTLVVDGATFVRQPGVKSWKLRTTKGKKTSDLVINTKSVTPGMPDSIKAIKPSKRNEELTRLFDENVSNGVRESRFFPRQQYSSRGTSRNQIPGSFKKISWVKGTRNLDIGAGSFEKGTEYLRSQGVENIPFDPYNRTTEVNNAALDPIRSGEKYDTVTAANLLNVVQEPEIRDNIIKQAAHALKPDGKAYFQVYEGDRSGVGRQTRTGGTSDNWQNSRTLDSYKAEVARHFGKITEKDGVLTASEPRDPGPVEWRLNEANETVREARENPPSYLFSYEQAVGELTPLFKTQKEKDILATIAQLGGRSPDYIATLPDGSFATKSQLMEQAAQIVMSRMPGFKKGKMRADSGDGRALGRYNADTGDIFIDTTNATDAVRFLDTLQHEIGHKSLEELANPSLRTYTSEVMYNNFDPETAARVAETYETSRTDFVGEELYAQYESGATPFTDTDSMRGALVSMFTNSNDEGATRTVSRALSFFARNADSGTFNEFLKASIMSDKNVQDALIKNNLDSIDNALARQFAEDYRNVAHEADVPLNTETLGYYLDAVLDHDTSLNVWKRQSMPC